MKKSSGRSILHSVLFAIPHELLKLLMVERTAPAQLHQGICDQPKASFAITCGRKILNRRSVEHDRPEAFHTRVARARQHRLAATVKHRNAKTALIIERKPVAIGAPHRKQSLYRHSLNPPGVTRAALK
jgi:hypothetical protein